MAETIRAAVVGVGHLGRYHAQKYAALPQCELVGVVDPDPQRCAQVAQEVGTRAFSNLADVLPLVDALSIASTTQTHHALGLRCLQAGKHVLIEKPLAATETEGRELVDLARAKGLVLQVGYLQRFNPAFAACRPHIVRPLFIEAVRIAPFVGRGADVDVVLDLMSHDLDLVLSLVEAPLKSLHGVGLSMMTDSTDLANVRLTFEDGAVASLVASRISDKAERRMRVFQRKRYFSIDFAAPSVKAYVALDVEGGEIGTGAPPPPGARPLPVREEILPVSPGDELLAEIKAFLAAVAGGPPPPVSGEDGLRALELSHRVMEDIARNRPPQ